jgi:predicted ATP-binding protein involved in virulence
MKINSLRLQNIRALDELVIQFAPEFNVIAGRNGTGKTTILTMIARIMKHWTTPAPGLVIRADDERVIVQEGDGGIPYKTPVSPNTIKIRGLGPDLLPMDGEFDSTITTGASLQREIATRKDQWFRGVDTDPDKPLPLMAFFSPYRSPPQLKTTNSSDVQEPSIRRAGYDGAFDLWANYKNLETWLRTFDTAFRQEGRQFPAIDTAREVIAKCLPGCVDVRFYARFNRVMTKNARGHLEPLEQLSDGYRTIAALVGELAWRATTLNPTGKAGFPENVSGLVLIDELIPPRAIRYDNAFSFHHSIDARERGHQPR